MKISAINHNYFKAQNSKISKNQKQTNLAQKETLLMPTTAQYLAFMGGYTISLTETYNNLKNTDYPNEIQEMVFETIKNNNPRNKTLYDIHFEKYKGVLDCYSLEELKEKYPEFKNVISAFDVKAKDESFIGKFQNNELELFSNDEDLTLQLIKLYWGQGFSLNDLSNYIAGQDKNGKGINLYYTMNNKLNIPFMNSRYASVLKLSNKEYNEQFTARLAIKLKEAKEAKVQQQEGEPVVIPKGKLSEAHKKHISESLKKHYQQHPEKLFEMSKRQKDFYQENPDKAQEMSEIMLYAWNETQEGKSVLKGISRFMRKNNANVTIEDLSNLFNLDGKRKTLLEAFWQRNAWAKDQFSIAVKKGYEHIKETATVQQTMEEKLNYRTIQGVQLAFSNIPTQVHEHIRNWARKNGHNPNDYIFSKGLIHIKNNVKLPEEYKKINQRSLKLIDRYMSENPRIVNAAADAMQLAFAEMLLELESNNSALPKKLKEDKRKRQTLIYAFNFATSHQPLFVRTESALQLIPGIEKAYLNNIQIKMLEQAIFMDCFDFEGYFQKLFDEKFAHVVERDNIKLS